MPQNRTVTGSSGRDQRKIHLSDQAESYADYLPEEAEKLRNAVAVQRGDVVAVAVCADPEKAAEQIWNYLD